ncbi:MAG: PH domain-containing protein [Planctomycetota bacterium]
MYELLKGAATRLLKTPTAPPDPPAGRHDSVEIHRAAPSYLTYRLLWFWILGPASFLLPIVLIVAGLVDKEFAPLVIGVVLVPILAIVLFCAYFAVRIDYDLRYYIVTDRSLRVREGAFIVKEKTITFANVQNLRVVQGPLLRLFGIWHLHVDTAGGGAVEKGHGESHTHRVRMAGIADAHAVRDRILGHLRRGGASAGLGDLDDGDEAAPRAAAASGELVAALRELHTATAALRAAAEAGA